MNTSNTGRTSDTQSPHKAGALKQNLQKTLTAAATALSLIALPAKAEPTGENTEVATISLGTMPSNRVETDITKKPDEQLSSSTSLTFTVTTAGTVSTSLRYQINGLDFGTAINQNIDLGYILERDLTGSRTIKLVDTTDIPPLNTGAAELPEIDSYFDRYSPIDSPLNDSVFISQPGTYTLTYTQKLNSLYGNGVGSVGNTHPTTLFAPIQVNFTPTEDVNGNSIPDTWEMEHLGVLTPADGDPDNDGQTNLIEYALNTNPTIANKSPITSTIENGYLTISFPKNPDATNLSYKVESSPDLQTWTSDVIGVTMSNTQEKVRSVVPVNGAPRGFLRVRIDTKESIQ